MLTSDSIPIHNFKDLETEEGRDKNKTKKYLWFSSSCCRILHLTETTEEAPLHRTKHLPL